MFKQLPKKQLPKIVKIYFIIASIALGLYPTFIGIGVYAFGTVGTDWIFLFLKIIYGVMLFLNPVIVLIGIYLRLYYKNNNISKKYITRGIIFAAIPAIIIFLSISLASLN